LGAIVKKIKKRLLPQCDKLALFECFTMKDGDCVSKIQKVAIKFKNLLSENEQLKLQAENASLNLNWLKLEILQK